MDDLTDGGSQGEELDKVDEVEEDEVTILRGYKASNQRLSQMIDGLQEILSIFEPGANIKALREDAAVYVGKMDHKLIRLRKKLVKMDKERKTLESIVVNSDAKKKETAIITKIKSQESYLQDLFDHYQALLRHHESHSIGMQKDTKVAEKLMPHMDFLRHQIKQYKTHHSELQRQVREEELDNLS